MSEVRLIYADKLKKHIKAECNPYGKPTIGFEDGCKVMEMIDNEPTVESEPVRHGRWKKKNGVIYCTNCKKSKWSESFELMLRGFSFCPKCGAKMDGGANDD